MFSQWSFLRGVGETIFEQSVEDLCQSGVSTTAITLCNYTVQLHCDKNFEGSILVFRHMLHTCAIKIITHRRQAEAATGTESATLDHHTHSPAFSQGLAGSVIMSLLVNKLCDKRSTAY